MFEKIAYAASQPPAQEGGMLALFFPFFLVFFIMYFLVWKPQQKQRQDHQKMLESLKKGDRIVALGGLIGTVTSIQNDYVVIKVGENENTKIEILKSAINSLRK